jgi:hypothetical protein
VIGGTLPLTDGFGFSFGGVPYNTMHFFLRELQPVLPVVFGVSPSGVRPWSPGSFTPAGVLSQPVPYGGFIGSWTLDHFTWPIQPVSQTSALLGSGPPGILGGSHWPIPVVPGIFEGVDFVFQMAYVAPNGAYVLTDPQRVFVLL